MNEAMQPSIQAAGLEEAFDGMDMLDKLMGDEVEVGLGPRLVYIWNQRRHQVPITGRITVGRSDRCDIQIPASVISRQHFQLEPTATGLIIHNVGALNPCSVNGKIVEKSTPVAMGDLIETCGIHFLYVE